MEIVRLLPEEISSERIWKVTNLIKNPFEYNSDGANLSKKLYYSIVNFFILCFQFSMNLARNVRIPSQGDAFELFHSLV